MHPGLPAPAQVQGNLVGFAVLQRQLYSFSRVHWKFSIIVLQDFCSRRCSTVMGS
jgi:hypothetical protein